MLAQSVAKSSSLSGNSVLSTVTAIIVGATFFYKENSNLGVKTQYHLNSLNFSLVHTKFFAGHPSGSDFSKH